MVKPVLKLALHEVEGEVWRKLSAFYEHELAEKRRELENPKGTEAKRTQLCWQIHTIKGFLEHSVVEQKNVAGAGE